MGHSIAKGVRQNLGSVAESNDAGYMRLFDSAGDHEGSGIIRADSQEGKIIRAAMKRALESAQATKIHRIKSSFVARLWVDAPTDVAQKSEAPFAGRGE